jgi:archaellum component FlaG (FlaF/FlaG flagellin family)
MPMLTGGQLAGLIVAVFWAILVSFLAYVLVKLARVLTEAADLVADMGKQAGPLLDDMADTVAQAGEQLGRVDLITRNVGSVTQNAAAVTTTVTSIVGGPLVKAAAFSYGVRKAMGGRNSGGKR